MRAIVSPPGTLGRQPVDRSVAGNPDFAGITPDLDDGSIQDEVEGNVVQTLQEKFAATTVGGVDYRIIRSVKWPRYQQSGRYEVVDLDVARRVLREIASESDISQVEASALEKASDLLADTRRSVGVSGLLLLRVVRVRQAERQSDEPALTPSQLARLRQEPEAKEEDHWVGIELLWDDGNCVEGARFVITTPDGKTIEGVTNEYGLARVEGIKSAGQCKIQFPDIDKDSWAAA